MKSSKHCSYPGTPAALWSKGEAAVALVSPFWMQEPMGKAAAPLAVKQMCRHSRAMPTEREADLDSKGRSKAMLTASHWNPGAPKAAGTEQTAPGQGQQGSFNTSQGLPSQRRVNDTAIPLQTVALWDPKQLLVLTAGRN